MGTKNTVELNGKKYDALTGKVISQKQQLDGFIHGRAQLDHVAKVVHKPSAASAKPKAVARHHARHPAHSTTLMRSAVKKPAGAKSAISRVRTPAGLAPAKSIDVVPAAARTAINERRLARSRQVNQSPVIDRFRNAVGAVQPSASNQALPPRPAPAAPVAPLKKPVLLPKTTADRLDDLLADGLARASSHQQPLLSKVPAAIPKHKKLRRRKTKPLVIIGVLVLLAIAIASILFYTFLPRLDLSIASAKSGVHATLPTYQPSGFNLVTPIKYASGVVTISYNQASTGKQYNLTEQNSSWDSQTLLDSFVASTDPGYQTKQQKNQTFYIYDQHDVTWVNGGIWYQIDGNANLSSPQLLDIATSM